jgi:hypothetical protein
VLEAKACGANSKVLSFSQLLLAPKRKHLCQIEKPQWSSVDTLSTANQPADSRAFSIAFEIEFSIFI